MPSRKSAMILLLALLPLLSGMALPAEDSSLLAWVRVVHLSPNAYNVDLQLKPLEEGAALIRHEQWQQMEYRHVSTYYTVLPGEYQIDATVDGITLTKSIRLAPDHYYTIDLMGLVVPDALEELAEAGLDTGFIRWLRDLVLGEDLDKAMLFQPRILQDNSASVSEDSLRVRLVHAAPGVEAAELVYIADGKPIMSSVKYGHHSEPAYIYPKDGLQVRLSGSGIAFPYESEVSLPLATGFAYTVFLIGTPIDFSTLELDVLILENPVAEYVDFESAYPFPLETSSNDDSF